jgi:hypothetical protein
MRCPSHPARGHYLDTINNPEICRPGCNREATLAGNHTMRLGRGGRPLAVSRQGGTLSVMLPVREVRGAERQKAHPTISVPRAARAIGDQRVQSSARYRGQTVTRRTRPTVQEFVSRIDGSRVKPAHDALCQLSRKLRSFRLRLGCLSLRSAFASIWRMRSRVTENCWPTSSSVLSAFMPMPKRMHGTRSSRGLRDASTRCSRGAPTRDRGLAQVRRDCDTDRQNCVLVLYEIAKVRNLFIADRLFERQWLLGDLENLARLLQRRATLLNERSPT